MLTKYQSISKAAKVSLLSILTLAPQILLLSSSVEAQVRRNVIIGPTGNQIIRGPYGGTVIRNRDGSGAFRNPVTGQSGVRGRDGSGVLTSPRGTVIRGPYGGTVVRPSGRPTPLPIYRRPVINNINIFQRRYYGLPGYRPYRGYYGLHPRLSNYPFLSFLTAGLLIASFVQNNRTVYVYVVEESGLRKEYRVDEDGKVLSTRIVND